MTRLLVLLLGVFSGLAGAVAQPPTQETSWQIVDQRPGRGEQCLVCRKLVHGETVYEIRCEGRTFHVGAPFLDEFRQDPRKYFARIQARSALFDENAVRRKPMSYGWLGLGLYVLAGLVCGAGCAYIAVSRWLAPIPWFFAGLVGNVVGLVAVVLCPRGREPAFDVPRGLRKVPTTRAPRACPSCGGTNHPAAARCARCGAELAAEIEAETARVRPGGRP